jgi:hypothetical protein
MAAPTPTQREAMTASYRAFLHHTSLAMLVVAPTLMALPPRKLDLYALALAGAFVASANHLTQERTGRGLLGHIPSSSHHHWQPTGPQATAEGSAAEMCRVRETEPRRRRGREDEPVSTSSPAAGARSLEAAAAKKERGMVAGEEAEGWKERRGREERDKIARGEGYGSMILDQIWEVWNWGEKNKQAEDVKAENKGVLDQRQQDERVRRRGGVSDNG